LNYEEGLYYWRHVETTSQSLSDCDDSMYKGIGKVFAVIPKIGGERVVIQF